MRLEDLQPRARQQAEAQLARLGTRKDIIDLVRSTGRAVSLRDEAPDKVCRSRAMNGTEAAYARVIESDPGVLWFGFEAITLKLGPRLRYTPDFAIVQKGGQLGFVEVKGFWRDDARAKIKAAAAAFPFWQFFAVTKRSKKQGGGFASEFFLP